MGNFIEFFQNNFLQILAVCGALLVVIVGATIIGKVLARNKRIAEEAAKEREALRAAEEARRREEEGAKAINERRSIDMDVVNRNRTIDGAATIKKGDSR